MFQLIPAEIFADNIKSGGDDRNDDERDDICVVHELTLTFHVVFVVTDVLRDVALYGEFLCRILLCRAVAHIAGDRHARKRRRAGDDAGQHVRFYRRYLGEINDRADYACDDDKLKKPPSRELLAVLNEKRLT